MDIHLDQNRETALRLASQGFHVFPCHAGGDKAKRPLGFFGWREASTTDTQQIREWWARWPGAAIGLDLGKSHMIVIDADRHGPHDGVAAMGELMAENNHDPNSDVIIATPNEGSHYFYRQKSDRLHGNSTGRLPPGIDVRGNGGYVIAPGTIMQDGRRYDVYGDITEAPVIPDWLDAIISGEKERPAPAPVPVQRTEHSDERIRAYCDEAIRQETDSVRHAGEGTRNNALNEAAFSLGQLVGAGWVTRSEIEALLTNAAIECGLKQPEIGKTVRSGLDAGIQQPRTLPEGGDIGTWNSEHAEAARKLIEHQDGTVTDESGEIVSAPRIQNPTPFSDYPDGLVGDVARWIVATARRPQPRLSIGAALCIVGTMAGRQFMGPTEAGTALFVLGLSPTASGKDHPLKSIGRIMSACNTSHHLGPSEFISMTAIVKMVKRKPLCIAPMDEFGDFMRRVYARKGSPHERAVPKILRTLWSANFSHVTTPEWAGLESEIINSPHLALFGVSTHEQFYTALEGGAAHDGTLNRFLIIDEPLRAREREPMMSPSDIPDHIRDGLRRIYFQSGEMASVYRSDAEHTGPLTRMEWGPGAEAAWKAYATEIDDKMFHEPEHADFLARGAEMAIRIATIIAAGRHSQTIDLPDVEYGVMLARDSIAMMLAGAQDYMAENENQANAQRIVRIIKEAGGVIRHSELLRKMQYTMKARDFRDIIGLMIDAGQIENADIQTGRGPVAKGYRLTSGQPSREDRT